MGGSNNTFYLVNGSTHNKVSGSERSSGSEEQQRSSSEVSLREKTVNINNYRFSKQEASKQGTRQLLNTIIHD